MIDVVFLLLGTENILLFGARVEVLIGIVFLLLGTENMFLVSVKKNTSHFDMSPLNLLRSE